MYKLIPAAALAALLGACGQVDSPAVAEDAAVRDFETDEQRIIYAIGIALGEQVGELSLSADEVEFLGAGFRDAALDAPYRVEMNEFGPQIQVFATERMSANAAANQQAAQAGLVAEKAASAAFADQIAAEPGAERSVSGLVVVPISAGDGDMPSATDTVRVHYHGTFRDGSVFDSSVDRGMPISFSLAEVIPCWTEGVQKIRVGGKAKLLCPSDIAYGDAGRPGIPGGSALLFEVELLAIE